LLDKDLKILAANRTANDWAVSEMGIELKEGEEFLIHFPEKYKPWARPAMMQVIEGKPHAYEAKYMKRDKSASWYHVRLAPISEKKGEVFGLCIVATDITKNKKAEAEIKQLNESLEKKVIERTAELEEANKELEAFTYSVSHDLLSPLRNIDSFIEILIEDYRNKLSDDGQYTLSVIKRNSTLMSRLIEDLLNFARFAKAPLRKQLVNMNTTVNEVIDELRFMTNKLAAKISLQDMHPGYCDPHLIKQVWVNLLSNAIKYSKNREKPEIEVGSIEEKDQIIYFIRDNGIGFDMQHADKLFGVFQRLHRTSEFEGTGVGLAIVHRIVTKHGGKIWAESKPNEGTVFYFTL
jgi:light-regulated signal transduction histidine kinase (bacteriophytochrome)